MSFVVQQLTGKQLALSYGLESSFSANFYSNGRTPGITLPSAIGQEAAIRKAYRKAGLPLEVDYVECHATGTQVGDSIEVEGLSRAFKPEKDRPLLIGAVWASRPPLYLHRLN